jgi:hypothetical protein
MKKHFNISAPFSCSAAALEPERVQAKKAYRGVASLAQGTTLSGAPRLALHLFRLNVVPMQIHNRL